MIEIETVGLQTSYQAQYNTVDYPDVTREHLGLVPEFFLQAMQYGGDTLQTVADAMDSVYQYGGFRFPFDGTVTDTGTYTTPDDPDLKPYATITYLDKYTLYCYPYAITALRDNETGETKIGRFD
tara:strand:- start:1101 stop:1475 length:375 start_codon:yes stop_codon:yes gene_type:complete